MFLIVLVDVIGFTIVIPLLAFYAEHFGASPLVATTLVSVYALCSLISTPIIGRLSDHYGRKPLLMYSQAGTCSGFLVLAFSSSLWMVFLGRILPGLSAGNLSIAQAYISDHTKPENRAKAFGVIGVAFGVGFTFGPALGAWLGNYTVPFLGNCEASFLVAAGMSALSIFCTYTLLPKNVRPPQHTEPSKQPVGPAGRRPSIFDWRVYAEYFGRRALRVLYIEFFLFSFGFSLFFSGFALFAEHNPHLGWGLREVGWLFTYTGVLGIILQGGLLGRIVAKFGELRLTIYAFVAAVIAYTVIGLSTDWQLIVIGATISAFGQGVLRPVITSRITQAVGRHEQGVALGISGSLSSIAMMLAPPTGGFLLDHHAVVAWAMIPAGVSLVGLVLTIAWAKVSPGVPPAPTDPIPPARVGSSR